MLAISDFDFLQQVAKLIERLALVLDQRVALANGAQPDALAQFVQGRQMAHPAVSIDAQHQHALHLAHLLGAQLVLRARRRLLRASSSTCSL